MAKGRKYDSRTPRYTNTNEIVLGILQLALKYIYFLPVSVLKNLLKNKIITNLNEQS